MRQTLIRFRENEDWFPDEPVAVWFRILGHNLPSGDLPFVLQTEAMGDLGSHLVSTSTLYGIKDALWIYFDNHLKSDRDIRYFRLAVRRVDSIISDFGDEIDSRTLLALGFSEEFVSCGVTTSELLDVSKRVLAMLPDL